MSVTTEWGLKYTSEGKPKAATLILENNFLEFPQQKIFNVMSNSFLHFHLFFKINRVSTAEVYSNAVK